MGNEWLRHPGVQKEWSSVDREKYRQRLASRKWTRGMDTLLLKWVRSTEGTGRHLAGPEAVPHAVEQQPATQPVMISTQTRPQQPSMSQDSDALRERVLAFQEQVRQRIMQVQQMPAEHLQVMGF